MYQLVIIFALMGNGSALQTQTAGPYSSETECDEARLLFTTGWPTTPGIPFLVMGKCLRLPNSK